MSRIKKLYTYMLYLILLGTLSVLITCTNKVAGSEVTNEDAVSLAGRVLDQQNKGVPNVIAHLSKLNLADTTDPGGNYSLKLTENEVRKLHINLDTLVDSVQIFSSGSIVASLAVNNWIDTLPSVYMVQRNIYGTLYTDSSDFHTIEAVVTVFNKDDSIIGTMVKKVWFNNGTKGFSGFIYFPANSSDLKYSVFIKVYNSDSLLTGTSQTVLFDEFAGDIEIPGFNPNTCYLKIFTGDDTTLTINDTLQLSIYRVGDSLSKIIKYEWNYNNTGFRASSDNTGIFVLPDTESTIQCIGKATDEFGNIAFDTIQIICLKDIPVIWFRNSPPISFNSEGTISAYVTDMGEIISWKWKIGDDLPYKQTDSNKTSTVSFIASKSFSTIPCTLTVVDEDNNKSTKSFALSIGEWKKLNSEQSSYGMKMLAMHNDTIFLTTNSDHECKFFIYDENYMPQQVYTPLEAVEPFAFLISDNGNKYLITNPNLPPINFLIYTLEQDHFVILDSSNISTTYLTKFTTLNNGTICISTIVSDSLTFHSYRNSNWTQKSIKLPSVSAQPAISSLVTIGNDCYLAFAAENAQPYLYKFDGTTVSSFNIGNYLTFNYLSLSSDNDSLYISGNYTGNNDSIFTFIYRFINTSLEPVATDIGGLYSKYTNGGYSATYDKQIIEVTAIDTFLFIGINATRFETMHQPCYSSSVYSLSGNQLDLIGNEFPYGYNDNWNVWSPPPIKIYKNNNRLLLIAGTMGYTYALE